MIHCGCALCRVCLFDVADVCMSPTRSAVSVFGGFIHCPTGFTQQHTLLTQYSNSNALKRCFQRLPVSAEPSPSAAARVRPLAVGNWLIVATHLDLLTLNGSLVLSLAVKLGLQVLRWANINYLY